MNTMLKLPIGIEFFEEMRTEGFYYVDKTGPIAELLHHWGKVNLFTRPRRFGKSLNMNMLKYFFSYGCDPGLFEGLAISGETELCEKYMGKYPVISITLKGVESGSFDGAVNMLRTVIGNEASRFHFLLNSEKLSEGEKAQYARLIKVETDGPSMFAIPRNALENSLQTLSFLLAKHYEQKVILLIDEYDVPLDKAQQYGYYDEMIQLIHGLFGHALKTNDHLFFAVLTGCLRIVKESIFTGLNNFRVLSITSPRFGEYFGFTDAEVMAMLEYYQLSDKHTLIKEWYDGYRFGKADVYCPWDVINYLDDLLADPNMYPDTFWINSSGNVILRTLLQQASPQTMAELDQLVNGLPVTKTIREELTYRELYDNLDNMWSVLFTTGYLTMREKTGRNIYELVIPNQEIRVIFEEQILSWFQEEARKDASTLDAFCEAFHSGDAAEAERLFGAYLKKTISVRDTAVRKEKKENFYHGILLGLLSHRGDWVLTSNAESGKGYSDILVRMDSDSTGIVIEIKYSETRDMEAACQQALAQIEEKNYALQLLDNGMTTTLKYGVACRRNTCMIRKSI